MNRRTVLAAAGVGVAGSLLPSAAGAAPAPVQPGPDGMFNLCFLGDSYMAGSDSTDGCGARKALLDWLIRNNERRDVRCVGSRASTGTAGGFGYTISLPHEGRPGWTTTQLLNLVTGGGLNYAQGKPNLLIVMAGANDFGAGADPAGVLAGLEQLVDAVLAAAPGSGVVLCEAVLMSSYVSSVLTGRSRQGQQLNELLPGLVEARADRVVLARTSLLDQGDINSAGVHPTDGGYQRMAYAIYQALRPWMGAQGRWLVPVRHPWAPGPDPLKVLS
ncbi:GDSL-type esterase/lipase family protein [Micromonospora sp. WMMD1128]|uniref:GDSL-type esterase/lipase family protein n=1 Tax=Micromonospora sp. WMMD1128 TaxID=3015150 RepID=UPI00248BD4EC|nr:GDSL-type esterase/lipase family protein [Micromonospora sp. WMMD1128]WBB73225.1 GDSL-type esterase/lipase family protein [Micromonospora sp. WMMD1128]